MSAEASERPRQDAKKFHQDCSQFYKDLREVKRCPPQLKRESFHFQRNITFLENPDVRDTILNLTLTALAPEFVDFDTEDFQRWFQINLEPVIASIQPSSLAVIPSNISCASYAAM